MNFSGNLLIDYMIKIKRFDLDTVLKMILLLFSVQMTSMFFKLGLPVSVVYGPLLLLALHKRNRFIMFLHFLPLILLGIFYVFLGFALVFKMPQSARYISLYNDLHVSLSAISLLFYSLLILFTKSSTVISGNFAKEDLIKQLAHLGAVSSVIGMVIVAKRFSLLIEPGFNPYIVIYGLILFGLVMVVKYLVNSKALEKPVEANNRRYQNQKLDDAVFARYMSRVDECVLNERLYLNANLSMDMLVKETEIPKHHLSQLFNVYIGKSFYNFIAEYRIKYAMERINDVQLTIDSLSFECGFNSKTSFNRYFKEYVGCVPSEYRLNKIFLGVSNSL